MANAIAIVGDTGTGKSTSLVKDDELGIIGVDPKETFIINVKGKPLPMRGWKKMYVAVPEGPPITGNYFASSDAQAVIKVMKYLVTNRPDIKNVILDDKIVCHL